MLKFITGQVETFATITESGPYEGPWTYRGPSPGETSQRVLGGYPPQEESHMKASYPCVFVLGVYC
jgi:hypothetical protein